MVQYWIETPIENALEVVKRYMLDPAHSLSGFQGMEISYEPPTEVVFYTDDLATFQFDPNYIYYGDLYCGTEENGLQLYVTDGNNSLYTLDTPSISISSGKYTGLIWNNCYSSIGQVIFAGYRFKYNYPVQTESKVIFTTNGPWEADIGTIATSQDDTPVSLYEGNTLIDTYSIYQTLSAPCTGSNSHIGLFDLTNLTTKTLTLKANSDINYLSFDFCLSSGYSILDFEIINCKELVNFTCVSSSLSPMTMDRFLATLVTYGKTNGIINTPIYWMNYPIGTNLYNIDYNYQTLTDRGWTIQ